MRILRHAQIDVTMNVYTEVSDAKTLQALERSADGSTHSRCCTSLLLRHEAQCYIARAAGRDERRYLWI